LDARLYVERWLLTLKAAAGAAGLEGHVRALDFKGGERLAFEIRKAGEALEICYRKRRTGAQMVAAATSADIAARVRDVHTRVLAEHRKLLENGFRRFLRRSIRLLETLESALYRDADLLQRTMTVLSDIPGAAGARPAAIARRDHTLARRYEILPAAGLRQATSIRFMGVLEGRLVDLHELFPKRGTDKAATPIHRDGPERQGPGEDGLAPFEAGTELLLVAADAMDSLVTRRTGAAPTASSDLASGSEDMAAGAIQAEHCMEAADPTEGGDILAEAVTAASDVGGVSVAAGEATVEVVSNAATAAAALAETGSALSDAACGGVDCGGLDCIPG
jgi:hypothetical protein